jgi:hypothetical protein
VGVHLHRAASPVSLLILDVCPSDAAAWCGLRSLLPAQVSCTVPNANRFAHTHPRSSSSSSSSSSCKENVRKTAGPVQLRSSTHGKWPLFLGLGQKRQGQGLPGLISPANATLHRRLTRDDPSLAEEAAVTHTLTGPWIDSPRPRASAHADVNTARQRVPNPGGVYGLGLVLVGQTRLQSRRTEGQTDREGGTRWLATLMMGVGFAENDG